MSEHDFQAKLDELIAQIPYMAHTGFQISIIDDGLNTVLPYKPELIGNPMLPALHGGTIAAAMEFTAIGELVFRGNTQKLPKTIDMSIDYLRTGKPQDTFTRANIVKIGRTVANVEVYAWQSDESKPIAKLHGHFLLP